VRSLARQAPPEQGQPVLMNLSDGELNSLPLYYARIVGIVLPFVTHGCFLFVLALALQIYT
jgi:hypothetical protein